MENQPDPASEAKLPARIAIRDAGRIYFLEVHEIEWLEASGNYMEIHAGSKTYLHRETMKNLMARLSPKQFSRVHRSVIVNIDRIKELRTINKGHYSIVLENGQSLETNLTLHELQTMIEAV